MNLPIASYREQVQDWPQQGRHILATYDDNTIVVYQAYRAQIARYALEQGCFGDGFSYQRMSWVKPGFLWMMHRSNWGSAQGQEFVLAIRLRRNFFESLLGQSVAYSFKESGTTDEADWKASVARSDVRLQWDPDHDPLGVRSPRRAIQLGLRRAALQAYGTAEAVEIQDVTGFVAQQREHRGAKSDLMLPVQRVYKPADPTVGSRIRIDD